MVTASRETKLWADASIKDGREGVVGQERWVRRKAGEEVGMRQQMLPVNN